ncbi:hypothetical protein ACX1N5_09390 [Acinetobacter sp. ANC 4636]
MKRNFLKLCLMLITGISLNTKAYTLDKILTAKALSCEAEQPYDNISKLYYLAMSDKLNIKKINNNLLIVGDMYLENIKSFTEKDKNINLSLMFFYKLDNVVIRKMVFLTSPSYSEDEWGGYYYIVEGSHKNFLNFAKKYHLSLDNISKTSLGNYRVTCIMVS